MKKNWQAKQTLAKNFPRIFYGVMDRSGDLPNGYPFVSQASQKVMAD